MLPALRPRCRLPVAPLRRLISSATGESGPPVDAAAKARAEAAARARAEAYKQVQNFDWSSGADWKTAANILFTVPPKRKEFGLDFHLVQLFFVCMPSLAVYLVAQYARREIKRMEAEAEEKRKKDEELEKQKQLEEESIKEDADAKLLKVLDRLDTLEGVVKEIVVDKKKVRSPDLPTKEDVAKKDEASQGKASDLKSSASDSQPVTIKSKDINCAANAPANTAQPNSISQIACFPSSSNWRLERPSTKREVIVWFHGSWKGFAPGLFLGRSKIVSKSKLSLQHMILVSVQSSSLRPCVLLHHKQAPAS